MDGGSAASAPRSRLLSAMTVRFYAIWELDHLAASGRVRRRDGHFSEFDDWSEGILAEEAVVLHKMDHRIASETKWSREGIPLAANAIRAIAG